MKFGNLLDSIGDTPLVEIPRISPKEGVRIYAKLEGQNPTGSLKDRIAKYMIDEAEAKGLLPPGKTILEATSGNTGISLAMIGKRKGYPVKVVMPENVSPERCHLLILYGAEVIFSEGAKGTNGAIEVACEMAKDSTYYMPFQYGNPANPRAHYETTGVEIIRDLPEVDVFVAGLGTGGTLMGVGRRLKEHNPNIRIVAVEPHAGELVQGLRSLSDGFVPPILDLSLLDSKMVITTKEAFASTKELVEAEGIFAGISSGAVIRCAQRLAQRMDKGNIVCLLADGGWKYLSAPIWADPDRLQKLIEGKIWW
ncbi:MAG: cysteine synthase family protein [Dehalococcoidia bacterium]|nr:cysteine synthase family protein [Dehalococcoidia bacterium]